MYQPSARTTLGIGLVLREGRLVVVEAHMYKRRACGPPSAIFGLLEASRSQFRSLSLSHTHSLSFSVVEACGKLLGTFDHSS